MPARRSIVDLLANSLQMPKRGAEQAGIASSIGRAENRIHFSAGCAKKQKR
jgi:hypothetical protein